MSWLISRALMDAYANSPSSPGLVEEYSAGTCSDGGRYALSSGSPTPQAFLPSDRMTAFSRPSRFGMTFVIAIYVHQRKMCAWTKNTGTERRANALSAARNLPRVTRVARSNVARMPVVAFFKQERRFDPALSAARNSCHPDRDTRRALVRAEPFLGCRAESLIRWSMCEIGLPFFAAQSLQGACETRQTERRRFSVTRSRNCAHTLRPISRRECHGTTTGRESTNGA